MEPPCDAWAAWNGIGADAGEDVGADIWDALICCVTPG
ncbi:hypothetical protein APASM_0579 [Actinosynnema pretiosum subsp. pretiosum]|nr:hypothetical protein APASM_0579 [Actinosynnema pretiosum subsp. pretiosum]